MSGAIHKRDKGSKLEKVNLYLMRISHSLNFNFTPFFKGLLLPMNLTGTLLFNFLPPEYI